MDEINKGNKIIGYIEKGIVIDKIPAGFVWKVAEILKINNERKGRVSLGDGYESSNIGKKGILKIEGGKISDYELNLIGLIARDVTVSIIEDGKVLRKVKAEIPNVLKGIVKCPNINCISNDLHEQIIPVINYADIFKCHFCGREFRKEDLVFVSV